MTPALPVVGDQCVSFPSWETCGRDIVRGIKEPTM